MIRDLAWKAQRSRERDGLQVKLAYDADAEAKVRELVGMERECCPFFDFQMHRLNDRFC